jgi:hypothetical protein
VDLRDATQDRMIVSTRNNGKSRKGPLWEAPDPLLLPSDSMAPKPVDPELEDILRPLSAAGLVVITTDTDGADRWTLTEQGTQVARQMVFSTEDDAAALFGALLEAAGEDG